MIKLSNYVADFLAANKLTDIFLITGGGAMHLDDAFGKHKELKVVCFHHEQGCALAAESYAKLTGRPAVVSVTSGPGGINALTGVFGAWTDSTPMIVISGQVKYETTVPSTGMPLRQLGDQEYDIVKSAAPMTKYAIMVTEPNEIRYHLEKALYLATHGRPGPVWLDIPLNVQAAKIEVESLKGYIPEDDLSLEPVPSIDTEVISTIIDRIDQAKRPVVLVGTGVRIAGVYKELLQLMECLKIPVVTAWNAHDLVPDACPYYCGRPGTVGDRAGNFVVQNSDLLLVLGCRMNIRQIGYNWKTCARAAYKIMVDIDPWELKKPTFHPDLPVLGDVKDFICKMLEQLKHKKISSKKEWLDWALQRRAKYPVVLEEYWKRESLINPYCFMLELSRQLPEGQITVSANGSACVTSFQAMIIKARQRLYTNSGSATMGNDIPAAIGACIGSGGEKIVCLAGDGSIQMNLQELAVIAYHKFPVKIFVLNNQGYHSMRQTQLNFFGEPLVGCDYASGITFPDFGKLVAAYGIRYEKCSSHQDMESGIARTLSGNDPVLCEVVLTIEQNFSPKAASKVLTNGKIVSRPLEDLAPFLSHEELKENMLIDLLPEEM